MHLFRKWVVHVCRVLGSVQTTSHICTHNVLGANELHILSFDLDLIAYQVKVTKTLAFLHVFCMTGGTLCVRLSLNHFTNLHILFANQFNISFVWTDSSQGHTHHQISLSFRVHVLYISIASLAIAQYHVK